MDGCFAFLLLFLLPLHKSSLRSSAEDPFPPPPPLTFPYIPFPSSSLLLLHHHHPPHPSIHLLWPMLLLLPFHLFLFLLSLFFILPHSSPNVQQNVPKELAGEGIGNKAGVRARLSQKGILYIATFLTDLLIDDVAGKRNSNNGKMNEQIEVQIGGHGSAQLTELNIILEKRPDKLKTRTEAPRQAVIEVPGTAFTCKAKVSSDQREGTVQFQVPNSALLLNVSALRHAQGSTNFRVENCQLQIDDRPLNVLVELADEEEEKAQRLKRALSEEGHGMLEQLVCSRLVTTLEECINRRFALLPTKMSLSNLNGSYIVDEVLRRMRRVRRQKKAAAEPADGTSAEGEGGQGPDPELMMSFNVSRADVLFLDYAMVADLRGDQRGLEMDSSGEVSLRGRGGTPFGPMELALPATASDDNMLQMLVSDFMPNSLLYHGHTIGLFNARVDSKTPHFGSTMRTSCPASSGLVFCLGDFFPTLRRIHPDQQLALLFSTIQSPVIKFRPQSSGGISFGLLGRIVMIITRANAVEEKVAEMEISVSAHMKIKLSSKMVRPRVTLDTIKLKTLSPGILAQEELDRSVLLAREVLQRMVNDILKTGIPIPVHPLMQLHKPKVKIVDRALLLLTNVAFNETLMRQLTNAKLEKRGI